MMRHWLSALAVVSIAAAQGFSATGTRSAVEPEAGCASPRDLQDGWSITAPQQQGLDPQFLCAMGKGVADGTLPNVDSIVVVRHGVLVYERYFAERNMARPMFDATTRHDGYSMTKSVTSLLVGIAVDRGLIKDLDAPVLSFFPEYADLRTPERDRITLRHLLTMSTGWEWDDMRNWWQARSAPDPYRFFLERKIAEEPGHSFNYDSGATELLGAILQKATGKTIDVLAKEELFDPLGIVDVAWTRRLHNGNPMASAALAARPRDWAKLGQLVLNHGAWQGKKIVSSSWIDLSTTAQKSTTTTPNGAPSEPSYGFQWWLGQSSKDGRTIDWSAALGFNAQKTIIAPALDLVVVFNASRQSKNMVAPEIELLDQHILPAIVSQ
jgi:CubicO group peptidase (beta-lactamase class C family)